MRKFPSVDSSLRRLREMRGVGSRTLDLTIQLKTQLTWRVTYDIEDIFLDTAWVFKCDNGVLSQEQWGKDLMRYPQACVAHSHPYPPTSRKGLNLQREQLCFHYDLITFSPLVSSRMWPTQRNLKAFKYQNKDCLELTIHMNHSYVLHSVLYCYQLSVGIAEYFKCDSILGSVSEKLTCGDSWLMVT